jgi:hypothetical protein
MVIFSDFDRTNAAPRRYSESLYRCTDRRAGIAYDRIRSILECWLGRLSSDARDEPAKRMQSENDWDFHSAFLELYVHELLLRSGHTVSPHPAVPETNKRPDFAAESATAPRAFFECVVVTETPADQRGPQALINNLYDSINSIECPDFFLSLDVSGSPNSPVPLTKWKAAILTWVNSLNYSEVLAIGMIS